MGNDVTLTEAERAALADAASGYVVGSGYYSQSLSAMDGRELLDEHGMAVEFEHILAAREQALREQIAGQIEAHGALWDHSADWRCGVDEAADIARGTVR